MAQINSRDMAQSVEFSDAILTVEEAAVFCRVSGWAMYKVWVGNVQESKERHCSSSLHGKKDLFPQE